MRPKKFETSFVTGSDINYTEQTPNETAYFLGYTVKIIICSWHDILYVWHCMYYIGLYNSLKVLFVTFFLVKFGDIWIVIPNLSIIMGIISSITYILIPVKEFSI